MSSLLQKVATLGVVLSELEKEIGIEDIGTIEKKVLIPTPCVSQPPIWAITSLGQSTALSLSRIECLKLWIV